MSRFLKNYWLALLIVAGLAYVFWKKYKSPTLAQQQATATDEATQAGFDAASVGMVSAAGF